MWILLAVWVVATIAIYALTPKPKGPPDAVAGKFEAATAESGRDIPVLFGTRDFKGPNIVWFGDISTVPIKSDGNKK